MMETRWRDGQPPTHADLEAIFANMSPETLEIFKRGENLNIQQVYVGPIHLNDPDQTLQPNVAAFAVVWDEPANPGAIHAGTVMQVAYDDNYHHRGHIIETFYVPRVLHSEEAKLAGALISTNALPIPAGPEWTAIDREGEGGHQ